MTAPKPAVQKGKQSTLEHIGCIAVDSGMIWISDPCQIFGPGSLMPQGTRPLRRDYTEFWAKTGFRLPGANRMATASSQRWEPWTDRRSPRSLE